MSKCAVNCNTAGYINPERLSFFNFHPSFGSICFYAAAFLAFKTFYRIKSVKFKSSVSKFIHIFEHSDLSPIYTAENFWHGSDEKSTRTKKIGSARIDLVV